MSTMKNRSRREFLTRTAAAGSGLVLGITHPASREQSAPSIGKSLNVLILGATGFIGPHFVSAAVERGHQVTTFGRHKADNKLLSGVEQLIGDRNGNLSSLKNRDWDAVLDLATYIPIWVRTLGRFLARYTNHYTFISTEAVYRFPGATNEDSEVVEYTGIVDAFSDSPEPQYGPLKALCEREAQRQFGDKTLILRPGSIVGPRDSNGLFTYWPVRMEHGGEILVGGDPHAPVQFIDIRDLADWALRMIERGETGTYNAVGPAMPMKWGEMLGGIRGSLTSAMQLTWLPVPQLIEHGVSLSSGLLFWPTEGGISGLMRTANDRSRGKGLTFRSLGETARDTLCWYKTLSAQQKRDAIRGFDGKGSPIDEICRQERALLALWHSSHKDK